MTRNGSEVVSKKMRKKRLIRLVLSKSMTRMWDLFMRNAGMRLDGLLNSWRSGMRWSVLIADPVERGITSARVGRREGHSGVEVEGVESGALSQ
jgi:hypothetical protein